MQRPGESPGEPPAACSRHEKTGRMSRLIPYTCGMTREHPLGIATAGSQSGPGAFDIQRRAGNQPWRTTRLAVSSHDGRSAAFSPPWLVSQAGLDPRRGDFPSSDGFAPCGVTCREPESGEAARAHRAFGSVV